MLMVEYAALFPRIFSLFGGSRFPDPGYGNCRTSLCPAMLNPGIHRSVAKHSLLAGNCAFPRVVRRAAGYLNRGMTSRHHRRSDAMTCSCGTMLPGLISAETPSRPAV